MMGGWIVGIRVMVGVRISVCLPFFSSECWDDECNVFDWEGVDCMEIIEMVSEGIVVGDFMVVETLCGVEILQAGSQMNVILS